MPLKSGESGMNELVTVRVLGQNCRAHWVSGPPWE